MTGIAYQPQSIDPLVILDVLEDISVWQPGAYDGKRKQLLRDSKEWYHI